MAAWLYIAGRGHSGSTMLDAMLGNADGVESVGELVSGMGRYEGLCSCGESFADCPYWAEVRRRFEDASGVCWNEAVRSSVGQAHIRRLLGTLFALPQCGLGDAAQKSQPAHCSGCKGNVWKRSGCGLFQGDPHALFLMRFVPGSRLVHLVRHPEKVLQSNFHRLEKGTGFKFLRMCFTPRRWFGPFLFASAAAWMVCNIMAEVVRLFGGDRFLRGRYDDLIASPVEQLDSIEKFAGVPIEEVKWRVREKQPFDVAHNIGGNHMRMAGSFVLDPSKSSL